MKQEKEVIKISLKTLSLLIILLMGVLIVSFVFMTNPIKKQETNSNPVTTQQINSSSVKDEELDCNLINSEECNSLELESGYTSLHQYKPIIYLYPTENTEISVELLKPENITCSYPKYENEWKVLSKPNGDLTDLETNKQLYALYYESKNSVKFKIEDDGFVVKGEDTITFLEEKLAVLGLTDREAEEFIVYWLPKLEANTYNYIRFATSEEINNNMPLEINPNSDTLIRVLMTYKGIEEPIEVQEQQLETPERTGFVAVEWGGTEIK